MRTTAPLDESGAVVLNYELRKMNYERGEKEEECDG